MNPIQNNGLLHLPECHLSHVLSFVGTKERLQGVKALQAAADSALIVSDWPEIQKAPQGSLIHRARQSLPRGLDDLAAVKEVRKIAAETLSANKHHLYPNDYEEMRLDPRTPPLEYTYEEMNEADFRSRRNSGYQALIDLFERIFDAYPQFEIELQLPDYSLFEHPLQARAERILSWMNHPENQELLATVEEIDTVGLTSIPMEILRFPNLRLMPFLGIAIELGQSDVVRAILNDPRPMPQQQLNHYFGHTVRFHRQMAALFIQSAHPLDPEIAAEALSAAAHHQEWDLARLILRSNRHLMITAGSLKDVLKSAIQSRQYPIVRDLLATQVNFWSESLIEVLHLAFLNQDWRSAWIILQSEQPIDDGLLENYILNLRLNNNWHALNLIIRSGRPLSDVIVGDLLLNALYSDAEETVQAVFNSNRPIDPSSAGSALQIAIWNKRMDVADRLLQHEIPLEWISRAVQDAVNKNDIKTLRLLLNSGQAIPEGDRALALKAIKNSFFREWLSWIQ